MNLTHTLRLRSVLKLFAATMMLLTLGACASGERSRTAAEIAPTPAADSDSASILSTEPITQSRATLHVQGLSCPLCASSIEKPLAALDGVRGLEVDLSSGTVAMDLAGNSRPSPRQVRDAVESAGFTLTRIDVR